MVTYSLDLRQRIVDAVEMGIDSKRRIAEVFSVHESFIYKLLRQQRDRGDLAPLPHGGGASARLTHDHLLKLTALVAHTPDATLDELRLEMKRKSRVAVSISTICRVSKHSVCREKKVQTRFRSRSARARCNVRTRPPPQAVLTYPIYPHFRKRSIHVYTKSVSTDIVCWLFRIRRSPTTERS